MDSSIVIARSSETIWSVTSWRQAAATICHRPSPPPVPRSPPSRRNVAVVFHAQYVFTVTAAPASRVKAALSKAAWWHWPVTPFDLESGVRITCDVGYLSANFSLQFLGLCSRVRPDVRYRQIDIRQTSFVVILLTSDVRQKHRLMPPPIRKLR